MKALRHRFGRWLLRDAPKPKVVVRANDPGAARAIAVEIDGETIIRAIRKRRGDGTAGVA
jgi:hypothetical protein